MYQTISPADMKALEGRFMEHTGMPGLLLMEHAAQAVADAAAEMTEEGALFVCGSGNNGGDGYAAARLFAQKGRKTVIWVLRKELTGDAGLNAKLAESAGIQIVSCTEGLPEKLPDGCGVIVDAMFGTGLSRPLEGIWGQMVGRINESGLPVLAVDIPSGIDGNTGKVQGCAVRAVRTVTFHRVKHGHLLFPGREYTGELQLADIGITEDTEEGFIVLEEKDIARMLPRRALDTHKGSAGHVLLIAGSLGMAGACTYSAKAALKSGAGLLTIACPGDIVPVVQTLCPAAMAIPLEKLSAADFEGKKAAALGPGLRKQAEQILSTVCGKQISIVVDADGLNALALWKEVPKLENAVLTPHPGEAARLLNCTVNEITENPVEAARRLQRKYGGVILLKGATTVITDGARCALNISGSPALAKGGSGDLLTGIILALLGQGLSAFDAAVLGAFVHGRAGKQAGTVCGERSTLPDDVLAHLSLD